MAVQNHSFEVKKNTEKSGAWLAVKVSYIGDGSDGKTVTYQAWTTQSAAKRWCAQQVGRSRLPWDEVSETHLKATTSEKVKLDQAV